MSDRRIDAFFYGLFMDIDILREADVAPVNPRRAYVDDFALRIGQRATLLPSAGGRAYGMLFALTHAELERLYTAPGLEQYCPEAVLARPFEGTAAPALCYTNLWRALSALRRPASLGRHRRNHAAYRGLAAGGLLGRLS